MIRVFIISLMIGSTFSSYAQIDFKVNLSPKHHNKVSQIEDARTKLKRYKKFLEKDKKKQLKKYRDSVEHVALDQIPIDSAMIISYLPDSSSQEDSLEWALNTLSKYKQFDEIEGYYNKISGLDSSMIPKLDSIDLEPKVNQIARKYIPKDLGFEQTSLEDVKVVHLQGLTADLPIDPTQNPVGQVVLPKVPIDKVPVNLDKDPKEQVMELAENIKGDQMAKLQEKMSKLKKKYVSIPNLSKPEEGIKRNSLKGRPLKDRIYLGGNFQIQSTDPVILDIDIQLGYKINKDFIIGTGFRWRESFVQADSIIGTVKDAHGYSGFVSHDLAKGFFAYTEYAAMMNQPLFHEVKVAGNWQYEYLLGIGRKFSVFKFLDMNVLFLYDFNHKQNNLHPKPFEVRIGYQVAKF